MSVAVNLAVSLPVLLGIPFLLIAAALGVMYLLQQRTKAGIVEAWTTAAAELGIKLEPKGSPLGPLASGNVNEHEVTIAPVTGIGRKRSTQYNVKFTASDAPPFRLIKRKDHDLPVLDTGNPEFDPLVVVQTHDEEGMAQFLTPTRKIAIMRTLDYWPAALVSNNDIHLTMPGIESESDAIVDAIVQLVATAETFDDAEAGRPELEPEPPTPIPAPPVEAPPVEAPPVEAPSNPIPQVEAQAPTTTPAPPVNAPAIPIPQVESLSTEMPAGDLPVRIPGTVFALDEVAVLDDLFNSGLNSAEIDARFQEVYKGRAVEWSGEIVRVGSLDQNNRQPIATLVGSADAPSAQSGRVVAMAFVPADPPRSPGDFVTFTGTLLDLDTAQRMFHLS